FINIIRSTQYGPLLASLDDGPETTLVGEDKAWGFSVDDCIMAMGKGYMLPR
ncbi:hypothetical protein KIPB_007296, partial [Kipferlia bialata]